MYMYVYMYMYDDWANIIFILSDDAEIRRIYGGP